LNPPTANSTQLAELAFSFEEGSDDCLDDPDKRSPGACGCGVPDVDGDENGTPDCLEVPPASCLAILQLDALAENGTYTIDPDGVGPAEPFSVACDMMQGGWTVISQEDFGDGQANGWHGADGTATEVDTSSACASAYSSMLGGLGVLCGGALTEATFDLRGIPHTEVSVDLLYMVLDSWDGEAALVHVDGVERYRQTFDHHTAAANVCGSAWADHGAQPVAIVAPHALSSTTVRVTSTLNSAPSDERFGVDDVIVRVR
jgi:hypothetical protein